MYIMLVLIFEKIHDYVDQWRSYGGHHVGHYTGIGEEFSYIYIHSSLAYLRTHIISSPVDRSDSLNE